MAAPVHDLIRQTSHFIGFPIKLAGRRVKLCRPPSMKPEMEPYFFLKMLVKCHQNVISLEFWMTAVPETAKMELEGESSPP